jgi:hypothetical protein
MNRKILYVVLTLIILIILVAYFLFWLSPPKSSNEIIIQRGAYSNWSLTIQGDTIYGVTVWSEFAEYQEDAVKLYHATYWGGILFDKTPMSWEDKTGSFQSKPLTLQNLTENWIDTENASIFKFRFRDNYYKVSFSIPKYSNGTSQYPTLAESWENGKLYQTIEPWD